MLARQVVAAVAEEVAVAAAAAVVEVEEAAAAAAAGAELDAFRHASLLAEPLCISVGIPQVKSSQVKSIPRLPSTTAGFRSTFDSLPFDCLLFMFRLDL